MLDQDGLTSHRHTSNAAQRHTGGVARADSAIQLLLDAGSSLAQAQALTEDFNGRLAGIDVVDLAPLLAQGLACDDPVRRRLLARHWIATAHEPVVVLIGGTSGTGKSSVSVEVARRLGIVRVIGTDVVRAVLRSAINEQLLPALHASTFGAHERLRTNIDDHKIVRAFEQQAAVVQQGVLATVRRLRSERLPVVIQGVHLVGGRLSEREDLADLAHWRLFILCVDPPQEHMARFAARARESDRDAQRYEQRFPAIRLLDAYIRASSLQAGAVVVNNVDFDVAVNTIVDDVVAALEPEWSALLR